MDLTLSTMVLIVKIFQTLNASQVLLISLIDVPSAYKAPTVQLTNYVYNGRHLDR